MTASLPESHVYPLRTAEATARTGAAGRTRIASHLRALFGDLDASAILAIEQDVGWVHLPSGKELFRQGERADGAYIVANGRLRVVASTECGERILDEVGPGQWIGEMALLTQSERSATVYAVRDTELVWVPQVAFEGLIRRHPQAMLETARRLASRLAQQIGSESRPQSDMRTLAVVPANHSVCAHPFTTALAAALTRYGSVLHLTAERVDQLLGEPGIANAREDESAHLRLARWLIECEAKYRFVIYEGDPEWSGWTDRVVRNADRIMVLAAGQSSPEDGETRRHLSDRFSKSRAPKRTLVLLQPAERDVFPGTARWLDAWPVDEHFHVRYGLSNDVERVARILTGNAVCLVFGGGASRGYAHIGVLRAFEELGIPIDAVGGTSMGAAVAAGAALGLSSSKVMTACAQIARRAFDLTLPVVSIAAGKGQMDGIVGVAGDLDIEDLRTTFFCVSTNLTRAEEVVHRRGKIATAVRASMAVPGLFPPVPHNGDLLVDGGLSNNVPVDTMASL
ncbi:MAG TPA: cyclic nucleotide-binding and patatin-like phospholipase domain-containing protein, partial [Polyangiaceae bacterium]|nr:cyclic nucleotide-binding and patatin-like phospholipase domain-containing protein [Polyangiaceae bacterium]